MLLFGSIHTLCKHIFKLFDSPTPYVSMFYDVLKHRGRNQKYSFHHLLGRPQGPKGCQKMHHHPLNLDLEDWCSNIEPNLNELQKTFRSHKNDRFLVEFHSFFQFWLNSRAPNLQIHVQWIMGHLLTPKKQPLGASK